MNLAVCALSANGVGTCGADDNQAQAGHLLAFGTTGQSARRSDQITLSASDDNGSNAVCVTGERMSALTTEGSDGSEDGTGRGTPLVVSRDAVPKTAGNLVTDLRAGNPHPSAVLAFDTTQVTSDKNYSQPREGGTDHPLAAGAHAPAVALSVSLRGRDGGATAEVAGEQSSALRASQGGGDKPHTLTEGDAGWGVRRLTPVECERLQGYPDDYTARDADGKPLADSFRYRALGNSVAIPVILWIAQRMKATIEAST